MRGWLEGEAGDAAGRDYYEHRAQAGQGYRNGYRTGRLKTAEGAIEYSAPQVAGRAEPYRSAIREHLKGHTQALEELAIEMLARGLSVRDTEDAFKDESGRLLLSKTAVSELGERLWEDYQAFARRDLSEYEIVYLFVDGIAERLGPGGKREPVLAAWGYTIEGRSLHPLSFALPQWLRPRSSGHRHMPPQSRLRPAPRSRRKISRRAMREEGGASFNLASPACALARQRSNRSGGWTQTTTSGILLGLLRRVGARAFTGMVGRACTRQNGVRWKLW